MEQQIKFNGRTLTIFTIRNEIHLKLDRVWPLDTISFPNAGVPGIIGPDITFCMHDLIEAEKAQAIENAGFDSVEIVETKDN